MENNIVWTPDAKTISQSNAMAFMRLHEIETADELISRSVSGIEWFWDASVHATNIKWFEPYMNVLDSSEGFPFCKWFVGGRLNITDNCVDRHAESRQTANLPALYWQGECGAVKQVTFAELKEQVDRIAAGLVAQGIGIGDRVALYLPMIPELVPFFYAIQKIGAVVVPIFSGFGTEAVSVRFSDALVKLVVTADGTLRRGQTVPLKKMLEEALNDNPHIKKCVVVKRLFLSDTPMQEGRDIFFEDFLSAAGEVPLTEELPSEHPCMVIYTSGTTGKPKGTVHTHAAVLAQVSKEFYFHFDFKKKESFFWVTDIGWMMGPWVMIGTHHFAGQMVMIEGTPHYPNVDRVLNVSEKAGITHLGISPTLIRLLKREGLRARKPSKLRIMGSTGEPWDTESYLWCFKNLGKSQVPIMNISGGTELMGCLLAPLPLKPLKACSLQGPALGMAVDIFNENGCSVPPGEVGFLVMKKPAPSMTKGFLNDNKRYLETYFSRFRGVWNHGDWAIRDEDGHWFLRGRADDTIKIAGKRTGPAEIESVLCKNHLVSEACAIGVPDSIKGEDLICFVVLQKDIGATVFLENDLKNVVAKNLGKTMKPRRVYFVEALPKTRSGKIVRGVIRSHYLGKDKGDLSSVENPKLVDVIPRISI